MYSNDTSVSKKNRLSDIANIQEPRTPSDTTSQKDEQEKIESSTLETICQRVKNRKKTFVPPQDNYDRKKRDRAVLARVPEWSFHDVRQSDVRTSGTTKNDLSFPKLISSEDIWGTDLVGIGCPCHTTGFQMGSPMVYRKSQSSFYKRGQKPMSKAVWSWDSVKEWKDIAEQDTGCFCRYITLNLGSQTVREKILKTMNTKPES